MTARVAQPALSRLNSLFGSGAPWSGPDGELTTAWALAAFDLLWRDSGGDVVLRRAWEVRKGLGARTLVLLAPAED